MNMGRFELFAPPWFSMGSRSMPLVCFFLDPGGAVSALIDDDLIATMAPPALRGASRAHGGARTGTSTLSSARRGSRVSLGERQHLLNAAYLPLRLDPPPRPQSGACVVVVARPGARAAPP